MATYAEFPPQTMATDFTLYPYQEPWSNEQSYLASTSYADQTYDPTPFDSFQTPHAFSPAEQHFPFGAAAQDFAPQQHQQQHQIAKGEILHPASSHQSPAISSSHSIEHQHPPVLSSTSDSGASVQSSISSAMGSPAVHPHFGGDWTSSSHLSHLLEIVQPDGLPHDFYTTAAATTGYDLEPTYATDNKGCVDPSLIQPTFSPTQFSGAHFPDFTQAISSPQSLITFPQAPSPAPSRTSMQSPRLMGSSSTGRLSSPYPRVQTWQPYPGAGARSTSRRLSISSVHSRQSAHSSSSQSATGGEDSNKGQCPLATCGRNVKDLKAHMLTHQNERPEKCPIPTCEYHTKGFARKYDKNRHTLTHYKGTMVCGFCPGSGSAAEKSFNRADVFKRHLTSVHGVEQTPPNARKKSPAAAVAAATAGGRGGARRTGANTSSAYGSARDVSGMCSTCGITFANAQDFYEHLDDCVLRVVQQADPGEAINEKLLSSLADDPGVQATMEKHMLPSAVDYNAPTSFDEEEDADEADAIELADSAVGGNENAGNSRKRPGLKSRKSAGNSS